MTKLHGKKPNLQAWREELNRKYEIKDILFFADYSHPNLKAEIKRIREISNMIIETQNTANYYKKDFTDFIILDHIYQHSITDKDTDCFILFTGDGHFSSVVSFLKNKCNKEVGIYAVKNAISGTLKNTASWFVEYPETKPGSDIDMICAEAVLSYLNEREKIKDDAAATLTKTVANVSGKGTSDEGAVKTTIDKLIKCGYLCRSEKVINKNMLINILAADWDKMRKEDFWDGELTLNNTR